MNNESGRTTNPLNYLLGSFLFGIPVMVAVAGCRQNLHTSDRRLEQMDEMLDAQLPQGTPRPRVVFFLNSQGFPVQDSTDAHTIVAIVHRVDTNTLEPATARVTFHFDSNDKLKSYELAPAPASNQQP